jgi:ParB family chromosome partitioning protein
MLRIASAVPRATMLSSDLRLRSAAVDGSSSSIFLSRVLMPQTVSRGACGVQTRIGYRSLCNGACCLEDRSAPSTVAAEITPTAEIRANGFLLATVSYPKSGPRISFTKAVPTSFVDFLNDRMETLHGEFLQSVDNKAKDRAAKEKSSRTLPSRKPFSLV